MPLHGWLGDQGYENIYGDALRLLRNRYGKVGLPYRTAEGRRVCEIEGFTADEHTVLLLAWGAEVTEEIESGRDAARASGAGLGLRGTEDINVEEDEVAVDQDWLSGFLLRWVLAEEYLTVERTEDLVEEHALEVLIKRDIPTLLSELSRSRPDLLFRRTG